VPAGVAHGADLTLHIADTPPRPDDSNRRQEAGTRAAVTALGEAVMDAQRAGRLGPVRIDVPPG
jgi:hypothetical protein